MQPSTELRDVVLQSLRDLSSGQFEAALGTFSHESGLLFIGTAPTEWITTLAGVDALLRASSSGTGNLPPDLDIQAWQEGTVGWGAYHFTGRLPDGSTIPLRWTFVSRQEGATWRCVQVHGSVGIPDDEVVKVARSAQ
jgi:hypothetical protein